MPKAIPLELIEKLPKTDLHVHLDGSMRLETILDLADRQRVELPAPDEDGLRRATAMKVSIWRLKKAPSLLATSSSSIFDASKGVTRRSLINVGTKPRRR